MSRSDMLLAMRVLEAFDLVLIMERLDEPQVRSTVNVRFNHLSVTLYL